MNKILLWPLVGLLSWPATAQDHIHLTDGTTIGNARVQSWSIGELKYTNRGRSESVSSDRVARVDLGDFEEVYRRPIANGDPALFITTAKQQSNEGKTLLAALGLLRAAELYLSAGADGDALASLEELERIAPESGVVPNVYRLKMELYLGKGDGRSATIVANKYATEATTKGWPQGFLVEAEFFKVLAEDVSGAIDPKNFQTRLRGLLSQASGAFPSLANRINVQLANSLRQVGDIEAARKIYEDLATREAVDDNSRAGAYLGLGHILYASADANNREPYREALLNFLHVYVETKEAWDGLKAEALYHASLSAQKWGGADASYMHGKLRFILTEEFPNSEWAQRAKAR